MIDVLIFIFINFIIIIFIIIVNVNVIFNVIVIVIFRLVFDRDSHWVFVIIFIWYVCIIVVSEYCYWDFCYYYLGCYE